MTIWIPSNEVFPNGKKYTELGDYRGSLLESKELILNTNVVNVSWLERFL